MSKKQERSILNRTVRITFFIVLLVYSISMIFPLAWGFMTSLKSEMDFLYFSKASGFPVWKYSKYEILQLKNYAIVFKHFSFEKSVAFYMGKDLIIRDSQNNIVTLVFNSLFLSIMPAVLATFVPAIVAYLCANFRYKFSEFVYFIVVTTMTIPIFGSSVPMIEFMRKIGLYDTYLGYFIQNFSFGGMYFLVFYANFKSFSKSYAEAAEIDGANQYQILFKIILPLSSKILGSVFLIRFVALWNDYQSPMVWMPTHATLAYGVYRNIYEEPIAELVKIPRQISSCMILALPVLIVFIIFKDKIMGNVTVGGLKG